MKATAKNRGAVLIVDSDPAVLVLLQRILAAADYHVFLAAEREDAVRIARQKHIRIDLVLMDVRIPGVSGAELADKVLALRPDARLLWMSGFVDEGFIRIQLFEGDSAEVAGRLHRSGLVQAIAEVTHGGRRASHRPRTLTAGAPV